MDHTDAQVTASGTDSQTSNDGQNVDSNGQGQDQSPINKRFGELTGTIKDLKAQNEGLQNTVQQMLAAQAQMMAQVSSQRQAPQAEQAPNFNMELPPDVDPSVAKMFVGLTQNITKLLEHNQKQTQAMLASAVGGVRQTQEQMEFAQAVQGQPKPVVELAGRLMQDWKAKGHTGWSPQDAIVYARGMVGVPAMAQRQSGAEGQDLPPGGGGALPPDARVAARNVKRLPDDVINRMPIAKREAYYASLVGDSPLEM